jgi:hypothetical protein
MTLAPTITVLMPAYQEAARVAASVAAARALPGVARVLVIDDGSSDETAARAEAAGAEVLRLPVNGGKGAALRAGLAACPGGDDDIFLLLDADLGETAAEAAALLAPVVEGRADLAVARFPRLPGSGGFGLVKGLARVGTWLLTRRWLRAPISGQRACRRWVLAAAPPAAGYGIEVAMNVAAADVGARLLEVSVPMTHAATGRTLAGFRHRGRQFREILAALLAAAFGRTGEPLTAGIDPLRAVYWGTALVLLELQAMLLAHGNVRDLLVLTLVALPGAPLAALLGGVLRARRRNYRGRFLSALGGLLVLPIALLLLWYEWRHVRLSVFLFGWLALGLLDDVLGSGDRRGFRGHVQALLHGRLTTGGVKLLGGGLLALATAYAVVGGWWTWRLPAAAVLIALSANALNLFDLRPGRALKVFWVVLLPLLLLVAHTPMSGYWPMAVFALGWFLLVATLV